MRFKKRLVATGVTIKGASGSSLLRRLIALERQAGGVGSS